MILDQVLFTPLAIPKLEFRNQSRIVKLYNEFSADINKPSDTKFPVVWKGITCFKSNTFVDDDLLHKGYFLNLEKEFSDEIEILKNYLPIQLESISLWTNVRHVNSHYDKKIYETIDDFRFRFIMLQKYDSFFISFQDRQKHIRLPVESNVFCFNNNLCRHGGTYREDNEKILGVIRGKIVDQQRLSELVTMSVDKYKNYCLMVDNF